VHLALARPLRDGGEPAPSARLGGGSLEALERAFDAAKYGEMSKEPFLEVVQPSLREPGWAPEGRHVASILVGWVPHALREGWGPAAGERLLERVLDRLERHDPGIRGAVEATDVWTPRDIEERLGLSGGQLSHGEEGLDQLLFMRPAPELARYATPVAGYFLGGAGSHPGGGITGVPGWLAAGELLRGS
jgi:phytoene dehydrogenase-like protein